MLELVPRLHASDDVPLVASILSAKPHFDTLVSRPGSRVTSRASGNSKHRLAVVRSQRATHTVLSTLERRCRFGGSLPTAIQWAS